jgi:hypothetical protein
MVVFFILFLFMIVGFALYLLMRSMFARQQDLDDMDEGETREKITPIRSYLAEQAEAEKKLSETRMEISSTLLPLLEDPSIKAAGWGFWIVGHDPSPWVEEFCEQHYGQKIVISQGFVTKDGVPEIFAVALEDKTSAVFFLMQGALARHIERSFADRGYLYDEYSSETDHYRVARFTSGLAASVVIAEFIEDAEGREANSAAE